MGNYGAFDRLVERYRPNLDAAVKTAICAAKNHSRKNKEIVAFFDSIDKFEFVAGIVGDKESVLGLNFILKDGKEVCSIEGEFRAYIAEDFAPITTDMSVVNSLTVNGAILFVVEALAGYIDNDFYYLEWEDFSKFAEREFSKYCTIENTEDALILTFPQVFGIATPCEVIFRKDCGSIVAFTHRDFSDDGIPMYNYCAELEPGARIFLYEKPKGSFEVYDAYPEYYKFSKKFAQTVFGLYLDFLDRKEKEK